MTIDQIDDRDPFALGGRNGETSTVGTANRASGEGGSAVGIAAPAGALPVVFPPPTEKAMPDTHVVPQTTPRRTTGDDAILAAFLEWIEATRASERLSQSLTDDDEIGEVADQDANRTIAVAQMTVAGAVGLAIKAFLSVRDHLGAARRDAAALWPRGLAVQGSLSANVQIALIEDLVRFVPELAPLVSEVLAAGRASLIDDDEISESADDDYSPEPTSSRGDIIDITLLVDDAAFLEAEREIARLYREKSALPKARSIEEEDETRARYNAQIDALEDSVALSPPLGLVSVAVKLRRLLDPVVGDVAAFGDGYAAVSLGQALNLIERTIDKAVSDAPADEGDAQIHALFRQGSSPKARKQG
jgi:hypothetical protein